jgi:hypothetical protein
MDINALIQVLSTDVRGPALGRLDRFDAIGLRAYGHPAVMGDLYIKFFKLNK